jgi:hypothetical protein
MCSSPSLASRARTTVRPEARSPGCCTSSASARRRFGSTRSRSAHRICAFVALRRRLEEPVPDGGPRRCALGRKRAVVVRRVPPPAVRVRQLFLADSARGQGHVRAWTDWQQYIPAHTRPGTVGVIAKLPHRLKGRNASSRPWHPCTEITKSTIRELLTRLTPSLLHLRLDQWLASPFLPQIPYPRPFASSGWEDGSL